MKIVGIHKGQSGHHYWVETDEGFMVQFRTGQMSAMESLLSDKEKIVKQLMDVWLEYRKEKGLKWLEGLSGILKEEVT